MSALRDISENNRTDSILIIEDDLALRIAIKRLLSIQYDTHEAGTIAESRSWIAASASVPLRVVLIDSRLPDGPGIQLIREFQFHFPAAALIVMTADADYNPVIKAIEAGADDYLVKSDRLSAELLIRIPIACANLARRNALKSQSGQMSIRLPQAIGELSPSAYEKFERTTQKRYLEQTIALCNWDMIRAAKLLGMGRSTLFARIADLGIQRKNIEVQW
jgi:DNA-binding NtrC family response regulator